MRISLLVNTPLRQPIFVLGIHTTDLINVTTTTSSDTFRAQVLSAGQHDFLVKLQQCPLIPGTYSFRLSVDVEDPIKNVFYCDGLHPFAVRSHDLARSGPDFEGFFFLNATWRESHEWQWHSTVSGHLHTEPGAL